MKEKISMIDTLITGGSGYIGKQLIKKINKNKVRVVSRNKLTNINSVICDLNTDNIPDHSFQNIKTVYHLAAVTHDTNSKKDQEKYFNINVKATENLVKKCIRFKVENFIFLSSSMASSVIKRKKTVNEEDQNDPLDIYGKSKKQAEDVIINLLKDTNIHYVILRPTLVYGEELKGNLKLMFQLIKYRMLPSLPETNNKKTLIHVSDLVDAIIFVKKNKRCNGNIFLVTDGNYYSTRDIYIAILNSLNRSAPRWELPIHIIELLGKSNSKLKFLITKMFSSNQYNSEKLRSFGFSAKIKLNKIL